VRDGVEDVRPCQPDGLKWGIADAGGELQPRIELPLAELSEPKAHPLVNGGALEVSRNGPRIGLLRYTNPRASRFATVAGALTKWPGAMRPRSRMRTRSPRVFVMRTMREKTKQPLPRHIILEDVEGNRYEIPDIDALDPASRQLLDLEI